MVSQDVVKRGFLRLIAEWDKHKGILAEINRDSMLLTQFINDEVKREQKAQELYRKAELIQ